MLNTMFDRLVKDARKVDKYLRVFLAIVLFAFPTIFIADCISNTIPFCKISPLFGMVSVFALFFAFVSVYSLGNEQLDEKKPEEIKPEVV